MPEPTLCEQYVKLDDYTVVLCLKELPCEQERHATEEEIDEWFWAVNEHVKKLRAECHRLASMDRGDK